MASFIANVAFDCGDPQALAAFWAAALDLETEYTSTEVVRLVARDRRGIRRLVLWRVPEPKVAKSRVHVDLATKTPDDEVNRLVGLGATIVRRQAAWIVMADPEGNEFCVG